MAMIMRLVAVDGGRNVAFGLEWLTPPGEKPIVKERRAMAREAKASHTVLLRVDQDRPVVGVARGLPRRANAYSAASLFSMKKACAVLVWDLGQRRVAIVGVRNGLPVVGFDTIVPVEEVSTKLGDFARLTQLDLKAFGNIQISGFDIEKANLEDMLAPIGASKVARLVPATLPKGLIIGVLIAGATVVAASYGLDYYRSYQADAEAKRRAAAHIDVNIAYRTVLPKVLANAGLRAEHISDMLYTFRSLPLTHKGWWLHKVVCQQSLCTVTWDINGGTFDTFAEESIPHALSTRNQPNFKNIIQDFPVSINPGSRGIDAKSLLPQTTFETRVGTMVQLLTGSWKSGQPLIPVTLTLGSPAILALPAGATENQIQNPIRVGTWAMQGKLWMVKFPASFPAGFTVESLSIEVPPNDPESATATIEGKYYVKK